MILLIKIHRPTLIVHILNYGISDLPTWCSTPELAVAWLLFWRKVTILKCFLAAVGMGQFFRMQCELHYVFITLLAHIYSFSYSRIWESYGYYSICEASHLLEHIFNPMCLFLEIPLRTQLCSSREEFPYPISLSCHENLAPFLITRFLQPKDPNVTHFGVAQNSDAKTKPLYKVTPWSLSLSLSPTVTSVPSVGGINYIPSNLIPIDDK